VWKAGISYYLRGKKFFLLRERVKISKESKNYYWREKLQLRWKEKKISKNSFFPPSEQ